MFHIVAVSIILSMLLLFWWLFRKNYNVRVKYDTKRKRFNVYEREYKAGEWTLKDWYNNENAAEKYAYGLLQERIKLIQEQEKYKNFKILGIKDFKKYEEEYPEDFI